MHSDPLSDLFTRIRNAYKAEKELVTIPSSKQKKAILKILQDKEYISSFKPVKNQSYEELEVALNPKRRSINIQRVSKPGQKIYIKKNEIKKVLNGLGVAIVSTSKGMMTGDEARKNKMGGEMICEIY